MLSRQSVIAVACGLPLNDELQKRWDRDTLVPPFDSPTYRDPIAIVTVFSSV